MAIEKMSQEDCVWIAPTTLRLKLLSVFLQQASKSELFIANMSPPKLLYMTCSSRVPGLSLHAGPTWSQGVSLTLTCVIMHGHGCYLYLCDESYSAGSSWQWECVAWQHFCYWTKLEGRLSKDYPLLFLCHFDQWCLNCSWKRVRFSLVSGYEVLAKGVCASSGSKPTMAQRVAFLSFLWQFWLFLPPIPMVVYVPSLTHQVSKL